MNPKGSSHSFLGPWSWFAANQLSVSLDKVWNGYPFFYINSTVFGWNYSTDQYKLNELAGHKF